MKPWLVFLVLSATLLPSAALAGKAATAYPATYAGGSLPLDHDKLQASFEKDEVVFMQGNLRFAVPVKHITEISYGTEVRRRLGASVLKVVPLMHLDTTEDYYIGMGWAGAGSNAPVQVLLRLGRAEYNDFLAALEQSTGIKAVNTNLIPTVVRYRI